MKIPLVTENDLVKLDSFGPGEYKFVVENVEEWYAQSGAPQLRLFLRLYEGQSKSTFLVRNTITLSDKAKYFYSLFFKCIGKKDLILNSEELDINKVKGSKGRAVFKNKLAENGKTYLEVQEFLLPEEIATHVDTTEEEFNDEIPF